jgi:hypothetical protein
VVGCIAATDAAVCGVKFDCFDLVYLVVISRRAKRGRERERGRKGEREERGRESE